MRYKVQLDPRHLTRLSGPLLTGIVELLWNAIDADATHIVVALRENSLGGIGEVEVIDDGHGIDPVTAKDGFLSLGRSWKAEGGVRSKTEQRSLHGKEGRGRFKLFRHGGSARWDSVSELGGKRERIVIVIRDGDPEIEIEELGQTSDPVGTRVVISGFGVAPQGLTGQGPIDRLLGNFALPIEEYGLTITYNGTLLDLDEVRDERDELIVPSGSDGSAGLTVIQWKRAIGHQDLYLCTEDGAALEKIPSQVPTPGIYFTAYLRWSGFADHPASLALAELDNGPVADIIEKGRHRLEEHFGEVLARRRQRVITAWQVEGVYPFQGEPRDDVERATRETFDVVALEAAETVNRAGNRTNKRLGLRLLREALEHDPGHVHQVLGEILSLPEERLADLVALLERTRLAHIISASRSISDRLDFLHALSDITCNPDTRGDVRERQHLHLILEDETWIFGEEYALATSEAGLTQVLQQHIRQLGREHVAPGPVRDANGQLRRVDLMLSASIEHAESVREHLVIELKRPSVPIGPTELQQVKEYALAVAAEPRFDTARTHWEFWAVSTEVTGTAERERRQYERQPGLAFVDPEAKVRVWVKTWAEIIHDAEHRLKYVKKQLGVAPDQRSALDYLRRVHAKRLPATAAGDTVAA